MTIFNPFLANAADYPKPALPILPLLPSLAGRSVDHSFKDISSIGDIYFTKNGRNSIFLALELLKIKPGEEILIPSYHCSTMIKPMLDFGLKVIFYDVTKQLNPVLESVIDEYTENTRAILLTHFFGYHLYTQGLLRWLGDTKIKVIEDCAHAYLFQESDNATIGKYADLLVASPRKFFPGVDGGALIQKKPIAIAPSKALGLLQNLKYAYRLIEETTVFYPDYKLSWLIKLSSKLKRKKMIDNAGEEKSENKKLPEIDACKIDSAAAHQPISGLSKYFINNSDIGRIAKIRRDHFKTLLEFSRYTAAEPLFSSLPYEVVPYMFPLILKNPEMDFHNLKAHAVPCWRWEDIAIHDYPTANEYRHSLVQIPCHQGLSQQDIQWIGDKLVELI